MLARDVLLKSLAADTWTRWPFGRPAAQEMFSGRYARRPRCGAGVVVRCSVRLCLYQFGPLAALGVR